ncbi:uncharacterized protein N7503_001829 [Penicillium pulvis]|uniref:uncharacterized protein n=1 Tax=Penicillium pulvis TaxID=1562058 RepID=UPI0025479CC4|nr:uncharacterized protein N7503_001829 [Penicillium pulvis]KAJ5809611.1 hypothetical protein N7503_001829 [Penicillium pulvis]
MAPVPVEDPGMSMELPDIPGVSLEDRDNEDTKLSLEARMIEENIAEISPSISLNNLVSRSDSTSTSTSTVKYGQGTIDPHSIKMQGLMALFAIIGAAFVLGGIWFFFWAKNGGFHWRKTDWDDYKSTVLRRKGPDGRTLSNATKSTKLGGGSIVDKDYTDDGYTYTDETYTQTASTIMTTDEKPRRKRNFKEKILRRNRDDHWEGAGDADVRAYREEKPAQIGGMNREADGTYHGSDYDSSAPPTHYNRSEMSEVRDYAYEKPRRSKTKQKKRNPSGFSFTAGSEDVISQTTEEQPLRDPASRRDRDRDHEREARRENRRREKRSAAASSVPSVPSAPSSRTSSPRKKKEARNMPGHFTEPLDFSSSGTRSEYQYSNVDTEDSGTKSYHHPIAGLSKGYRRDDRREGRRSRRRDSLSDSDGDETRYS